MPQIIKQEDGSELEVFTKDELEAETKKATEEIQKQVQDSTSALEQARKELEETKAQIDKTDSKDENIKALRNLVQKQEKAIKTLEEKVSTDNTELKTILTSSTKSNVFAQITKGDKELAEKMELNWKLIQKDALTEDEIREKALLAYKMSVDTPNPRVINGVISNVPQGGGSGSQRVDEELSAIAGRFGISEDDIKKYSK